MYVFYILFAWFILFSTYYIYQTITTLTTHHKYIYTNGNNQEIECNSCTIKSVPVEYIL